ncbi:alpha-ketoglutarate-dependent dioxygenase AlkB family protein [Candidatus Uabimicrobium amorphum]|uniref:Alkylated DNA repair protein n=1 Tax=Uabimicrobium amorphum TaxID=2596890 RepID=A0A5S9IUZ1_UABAM|nr:alpha-ketoglutarate-dependent dioxygenase AlkB [Candidatus Uabimicrobium amorphum]BBM88227.1 alkylated DNA repair protein [Candidatus Uabimicrobium amorphum]
MSSQKFSNPTGKVTVQRDLLDIEYCEDFFSEVDANGWFEYLAAKIPWERREIFIMGKKILQPRLICWYGDVEYTYSRSTLPSRKWTPQLQELKTIVEEYAQQKFNSCLLNFYRDGKDSMGYHSDDEKVLGKNPFIASLSFGGKRRFVLKHKKDKSIEKVEIELGNGSLLLMKSQTQHYWLHGIPKTQKEVKPRINLTFRWTYPK